MTSSSSIFEANDEIIDHMRATFLKEFGQKPYVVGRAPGRLTLIGDHIDYCGFSVLLMATQGKFTTVMLSEHDHNKIKMRNLDMQFPSYDVDLNPVTEMKSEGWSLFAEGAVKSFCRTTGKVFKGINMLIDNTVPISSGLSSSGAILCAIVVALDELAGTKLSKQDLITISINAEHIAGFMTGGMDQNVTILAKRGFACLVSFDPPSVRPIKLPPAKFVVAHCGVGNSKIDNPLNAYHQRLKEVTQCATLMKNGCKTIREVVKEVGPDEALNIAKRLPERDGDFVLKKRAMHVLEESARVKTFCTSEIAQWGKLMNESHSSLRDLYECSCPDLEALVEAGIKSGAIGARQTGSGWGGCAQFLLQPSQDSEAFIQMLKKEYFEPRKIKNPIVFVTHPGPGAASKKI